MKDIVKQLMNKGVRGYTEPKMDNKFVSIVVPVNPPDTSFEQPSKQRFYIQMESGSLCRLRDIARTGRLLGAAEALFSFIMCR